MQQTEQLLFEENEELITISKRDFEELVNLLKQMKENLGMVSEEKTEVIL